jgi:hypothetical protein
MTRRQRAFASRAHGAGVKGNNRRMNNQIINSIKDLIYCGWNLHFIHVVISRGLQRSDKTPSLLSLSRRFLNLRQHHYAMRPD